MELQKSEQRAQQLLQEECERHQRNIQSNYITPELASLLLSCYGRALQRLLEANEQCSQEFPLYNDIDRLCHHLNSNHNQDILAYSIAKPAALQIPKVSRETSSLMFQRRLRNDELVAPTSVMDP